MLVAPGAGCEGIRKAGVIVGKGGENRTGVGCLIGSYVMDAVSVGAGKSPAESKDCPLQAARKRRTVNRIAANTFVIDSAS